MKEQDVIGRILKLANLNQLFMERRRKICFHKVGLNKVELTKIHGKTEELTLQSSSWVNKLSSSRLKKIKREKEQSARFNTHL